MGRLIDHILPTTLKLRLFVAFIVLILLPFSLLMLHHFSNVESVLQRTFSEQSMEQMQKINQSFDEMINDAYRTSVLLNQDSLVRRVLQKPEQFNEIERVSLIEERFRAINNSLFLTTPQVFYTIVDLQGHVYSSYMPAEAFSSQTQLQQSPRFQEALKGILPYTLAIEPNYVHAEVSRSPDVLSIHVALLDGSYKPYAVARISIDYYQWYQNLTHAYSSEHIYAIVRPDGIIQSSTTDPVQAISFEQLDAFGTAQGHYESDGSIINYSFMPSMGWYLVKQVPTDIVFAEVKHLKRSFFITFLVFTAAFIGMTFLIASAVTRPLKRFQESMSQVAQSQLKIHLPEEQYRGEVLQLATSFNQMVSDIQKLVKQLNQEERMKEAVHFRMLHSQTNPHFLLNTLNTIKWIAMNDHNQRIVDICLALGRLLEAGLNSERELIHLKDEIELVNAFIQIQCFRYNKQYEINWEYDDTVSFALVPKLSLQPLVDNAITHGFTGKSTGIIQIRITADDKFLDVAVLDNGIGPEASKKHSSNKHSGIGLNNLRERLHLLFKDQASLEITSTNEGTLVYFRMPLLISEPYE
ncbi:cache domain-containing sensor histidine kinase [Paenibacillus nasutitermitis]|uniref:Histidine kinase n=1 Tax=Paenibacillus nasutitermitis TaxID=1652958 RepID=A0A916Z7F5_9BACL|nr:sensor histidine kinase [Paenibacillus nasutitermitis]GGD78737.1 histidine kinase [Paenibacillus nasutitermitis]